GQVAVADAACEALVRLGEGFRQGETLPAGQLVQRLVDARRGVVPVTPEVAEPRVRQVRGAARRLRAAVGCALERPSGGGELAHVELRQAEPLLEAAPALG